MTEAEFKQYVRVKSCQSGFKNVDITDTKTLQFRKGSEFTTYNFSYILSCTQNQVKTYETIAKKSVEKLIEGFSSTIIGYGAPNSGKTYTLIGKEELLNRTSDFFNGQDSENIMDMLNDPSSLVKSTERGIMLRAIEYIFTKAKSYDHIKHFIVSVSCLELARDKIVDLGRKFFKFQDPEPRVSSQNPFQNLTIEQDQNGNYDVPGLTVTAIKSIGNFYRFLKEVFRDPLRSDSHFMLEINLLQSDKQNTDLENTQSSLTFLELAYLGPDKQKQQDCLLLQSQLNSLIQVLRNIRQLQSSKQVFRQSRLTKILKNSILRSNNICLIGTLELKTQSINESFSTLNFLNRTKQPQIQQRQESANSTVLELRAKYQKLSRTYEGLIEEHRQKMQQLQDYIGLEVNLNQLHRHNHNAHEINQINTFKQAVERVKWLNNQRNENDRKIQNLEHTLGKEMKIQEERENEFQGKKIQIQMKVAKLRQQIRVLQQNQGKMYKQHMSKYERQVQEVNLQTQPVIVKCSKDIQKVSNVTTLLNNLMEGKSLYQQAEMSAKRDSKDALRKKIQELSHQRQESLLAIRQRFENSKRALDLKLVDSIKTSTAQQQQNNQLNRQISQIFHAIQTQEKAIKQLLTQKYESNYKALSLIKTRKHRLNINKQLYECLSSQGNYIDANIYKSLIISKLKEDIFATRLKLRG